MGGRRGGGSAAGVDARPDLGHLLHAAARAFDMLVGQSALVDGDCSKRAFGVLGQALTGPPRNQLEIGRALGLDRTVMVGIVDELEANGLVARQLDPKDRRARLIAPTAAGRQRHSELQAKIDAVVARLTAELSDTEVDALLRALTSIAVQGPIPLTSAAVCDEPLPPPCDE
ncbi:MAG: regulatory protein MarR [Acidimicrobiales bacterium]|nr:regulatory protein MarR [Acidimicrobiales bacterium]